jgi:AraC family transcriptional regulator
MNQRPLTFTDPGRFEISCHHLPVSSYPEETHAAVEVCVPLERARYSVAWPSETGPAQVQHLGARDILVVPANLPHAVDWQRPADIVSLRLSESFVAELLGIPHVPARGVFTIRDPFISAAAVQLRATIAPEGTACPFFTAAIATAIACRVAVARLSGARIGSSNRAPALSPHQATAIERHVDAHLDEPITVEALAALVGLSQWHFVRRFKARHDLSPHGFIAARRLARAQTLLATSPLSIASVALEVGMSHSHFSRMFLSRIGLSPREYRRGLRP